MGRTGLLEGIVLGGSLNILEELLTPILAGVHIFSHIPGLETRLQRREEEVV